MLQARILLVDDAALVRRVVAESIAREPDMELIGTAEDGRVALKMIHLLGPDLVILDVEMPVVDGWETLKAIRLSYPALPVIMFSSLMHEGHAVDRALALGAAACVPKPAAAARSAPHDGLGNLLNKIRSLCKDRRRAF